jgi:hypothetical protein
VEKGAEVKRDVEGAHAIDVDKKIGGDIDIGELYIIISMRPDRRRTINTYHARNRDIKYHGPVVFIICDIKLLDENAFWW